MIRGRMIAATLIVVFASALSAPAADEPKLPDVKTFDKLVIDSLRNVHNKGADLYNESKDFAGAYRVYEGGLMAVRPLLAHRPEAQKLIDTGLATAEKETEAARKAFVLHDTIEAVRKYLKVAIAATKPDVPPKKPDDIKKPVDPVKPALPVAPEPHAKPKEKANPAATSTVTGTVTLKGQPLAGGEVTFTLLDTDKPKVLKAKTDDDGTYTLQGLPAGKYAVSVSGKGVAAKFNAPDTSGLTVEVLRKTQVHDINLK